MKKTIMIAFTIFLLLSGCRAGQKAVGSAESESVYEEQISSDSAPSEQRPLPETTSEKPVYSSKEATNVQPKRTVPTKEDFAVSQSEQVSSVYTESAPAQSHSEIVTASSKDTKEIAKRMVFYLNEYRKEQGVLPADILDEYIPYAEYRSRQLVSHFAHDTLDEREAATAVQVGIYVDPSLYGMDGEPYYSADVREAIAMTGFSGTVEEAASHLATMIRNSPDHWAYVGGADYTKIAVGVTYVSGLWYADIAMKN